jgi:glycosyltransferase involved in cell wall biosynthesis
MTAVDNRDLPAAPLVSVVIPTYRRPALLPRAVASVLAQTFRHWELLISDDEAQPGETWEYLKTIAEPDSRIRVFRNPGPHCQVGNVNFLLRAARGEWIKPLYDDDAMRPRCLELMIAAARGHLAAAMVSCLAEHYHDLRSTKVEHRRGRPPVEYVPQRYVHLGMYLQDFVGGGTPTHVMVRQSAVERGALMEAPEGIISAVDSWWFARVLQHGDSLLVNDVLVESHQGSHESITSGLEHRQADLDHEFRRLRELQYPLIDASLNPPTLGTVVGMLALIRAANRAAKGHVIEALSLGWGVWRPASWWLALLWALRQCFPSRFSAVPHYPVSPMT